MTAKQKFKVIHRAFRLMDVNDVDVRGFYYPGRKKLFYDRAAQGADHTELWIIATASGQVFDAARTAFIGGRVRFSGWWDDTPSRITRRRSRQRLLAAG